MDNEGGSCVVAITIENGIGGGALLANSRDFLLLFGFVTFAHGNFNLAGVVKVLIDGLQ